MKKILLPLQLSLLFALLGLTGCVAVPVNDGYRGGYAPAVVVRPWYYGSYGGGRGYYR